MCADLPKVAFLAMDARHCAGAGDGRDDGLCRLRSARRARKRKVRRGGLYRQRHRTRPPHFFGQRPGRRHDAARPDRLCRLDAARGRDVPRDLPRRADDRAGRLFRPRDHRCGSRSARRFPELAAAGHAGGPHRHAGRPLLSKGSIRRRSYAVLERFCARNRSAATAARRSCATSSAPACRPPRSSTCAPSSTARASRR